MISFNSQNRADWYFAVAMLLVMMVLQVLEAPTFRYQHNWLENRELWRLLTAHWVHVNWIHFFLNGAGLMLCLMITSPGWSVIRWLVYQLILAPGISILFSLFNPELDWYAGYSGVLYGIFLIAAIDLFPRDRLIALFLIAAIVIKIAIEQTGEINLTTSDIIGAPVIVDAHLYGFLLAFAIAIANRIITLVRDAKLNRAV